MTRSWLSSPTASAARRWGWHSAGCRWDKGQRCPAGAAAQSTGPWLATAAAGAAGALAAALISFSARATGGLV
jgi:hypothetical protein